jgi:hypothetical protein
MSKGERRKGINDVFPLKKRPLGIATTLALNFKQVFSQVKERLNKLVEKH